MNAIEEIKSAIIHLYTTSPNIHINATMTHPKLVLKNAPAVIKGVYPNVFRVEEIGTAHPICHSFQYADILTKRVRIAELEV